MGNQHGYGIQSSCSTYNSELAERFMVDKDFRIDYRSAKQNMDFQPRQKLGSVQRQQITMLNTSQQQESEETVKIPIHKVDMEVLAESKNVQKQVLAVFDGLYGNIKVMADGFVQYEDSRGIKYYELFDKKGITKSFPSGISLGGLTKSIWFKDGELRDTCFGLMSGANDLEIPETDFEVEGDKTNYTVFNGIQGNEVVLFAENRVEYIDIHGKKHNVSYNGSKVKKCFPSGICFGGLPSTVWLHDELIRDKCFNCMKNQEKEEEQKQEREEDEKMFTGLYGDVSVKTDYEVEFTTLIGDKVTCSFDPLEIRKVFPMGITNLSIPSTIWFSEMDHCENCFQEMRKTS